MLKFTLAVLLSIMQVFGAASSSSPQEVKMPKIKRSRSCDAIIQTFETVTSSSSYSSISSLEEVEMPKFKYSMDAIEWIKKHPEQFQSEEGILQARENLCEVNISQESLRKLGYDLFSDEYQRTGVFSRIEFWQEAPIDQICDLLRRDDCWIREINLGRQRISDENMIALGQALQANRSLSQIFLDVTGIGHEAARALVEAHRQNQSLALYAGEEGDVVSVFKSIMGWWEWKKHSGIGKSGKTKSGVWEHTLTILMARNSPFIQSKSFLQIFCRR